MTKQPAPEHELTTTEKLIRAKAYGDGYRAGYENALCPPRIQPPATDAPEDNCKTCKDRGLCKNTICPKEFARARIQSPATDAPLHPQRCEKFKGPCPVFTGTFFENRLEREPEVAKITSLVGCASFPLRPLPDAPDFSLPFPLSESEVCKGCAAAIASKAVEDYKRETVTITPNNQAIKPDYKTRIISEKMFLKLMATLSRREEMNLAVELNEDSVSYMAFSREEYAAKEREGVLDELETYCKLQVEMQPKHHRTVSMAKITCGELNAYELVASRIHSLRRQQSTTSDQEHP